MVRLSVCNSPIASEPFIKSERAREVSKILQIQWGVLNACGKKLRLKLSLPLRKAHL